jgi:hypothetical protein
VIDARQLHLLQHALGLDQHGRGTAYRNHFVTGEGSDDHSDCIALVAYGFMTMRTGSELSGGDDIFRVTDAGRDAVAAQSPKAPKIPRAKQRYLDYLEADSSSSFIDWLRWNTRPGTGTGWSADV